jgi:hypothetical protein
MDLEEGGLPLAEAIGPASFRLKNMLRESVPTGWHEGVILVQAADQPSEKFCSILKPLYNPDSTEEIHELPDDFLAAMDDLYRAFLPYMKPWKFCQIKQTRSRLGGIVFCTEFSHDYID